MRDKIIQAVLVALLLWAGATLLEFQDIKRVAEENRASIQALIAIHLGGE